MTRRDLFCLACAAVLAGLAGPVAAQAVERRVIVALADQGYTRIMRTRTLLGRVRIIGVRAGVLREVVVNPSTNEILRDVEIRSDRIPDLPPVDPSEYRGGG